ncbi:hypothetical protein SAMN05216353_12038 [Halobacillus alkaliphilus]|uniref:Uncharacterized protein n=1 Tax=Halobacillus alkaliphilus TaxID=396056 RepID=A0A1I2NP38_9BACI|nr:hypothetical protein SAMN05216353_12038 [Halobacillus alkaliphilus]
MFVRLFEGMLLDFYKRSIKQTSRIVEDSVSRYCVEKGAPGNGSLSAALHDAGSFDVATGRGDLSRTSLVVSLLRLAPSGASPVMFIPQEIRRSLPPLAIMERSKFSA